MNSLIDQKEIEIKGRFDALQVAKKLFGEIANLNIEEEILDKLEEETNSYFQKELGDRFGESPSEPKLSDFSKDEIRQYVINNKDIIVPDEDPEPDVAHEYREWIIEKLNLRKHRRLPSEIIEQIREKLY